ncbi:type II secretion system F family protein [Patescibacteria group bacterium]|nr:type II secretion system F family protein [Patescibacteria group bacterium]
MKKFSYIAKNDEGAIKKGVSEAESRDDLIEALKKQKMTAVTIKEVANNQLFSLKNIGFVSSTEKVMFSKELATMVSAGIPILQAIHILQDQSNSTKLKSATVQIAQDIEGGLSLSSAMEKHPSIFSPLYINMVKAGEIGGMLDDTLEKMADEIEKEHELVASVRGAMTYPTVIMVVMVGVVFYLLTNVIPKISTVFTDLGGDLPAPTKMLLALSNAMQSYGLLIAIVIAGLVIGVRILLKKNLKARYSWHSFLLKLPVFGKLMKKINITRFTRTLGSLLSSGVAVLEAMEIASSVLRNEVFKKEIKEASKKVQNGSTLSEPLQNSKVFSIMVSQMIAVGEDTGTLDKILLKLTTFYQKEVDHTVNNLSSLLEPVMMIIIGAGAGFIVISIITPIYSMADLF